MGELTFELTSEATDLLSSPLVAATFFAAAAFVGRAI